MPTTEPVVDAERPATDTAWQRFWFAPAPGWTYLLVAGITFGVAALTLFHEWRNGAALHANASPARWDPVTYYQLLPQPRGDWLVAFYLVVVVACVAAAVVDRWWVKLAAALPAAYLLGLGNNFGKINHGRNTLVIALLAFAVGAVTVGDGDRRSWRYRWPVAAAQSAVGFMFLWAAVSKLRVAGLGWVTTENLRNVLVMETTLLRSTMLPDVAAWVAGEPWRWMLAAAGALAGEALLIVGVVSRDHRIRLPLVGMGIGVLAGLNVFLDLGGWTLLASAFVLFDFERTAPLRGRARAWVVAATLAVALPAALVVHLQLGGGLRGGIPTALLLAALGWGLRRRDELPPTALAATDRELVAP